MTYQCPRCGLDADPAAATCPWCGQELNAAHAVAVGWERGDSVSRQHLLVRGTGSIGANCWQCGHALDAAGDALCPHCGTVLRPPMDERPPRPAAVPSVPSGAPTAGATPVGVGPGVPGEPGEPGPAGLTGSGEHMVARTSLPATATTLVLAFAIVLALAAAGVLAGRLFGG